MSLGLIGAACTAQEAQPPSPKVRVSADHEPEHPPTAKSFERWVEYIRPSEEEACWNDVQWRQSFREGVRDSQIEGKPILLWAMNGHPMGCV